MPGVGRAVLLHLPDRAGRLRRDRDLDAVTARAIVHGRSIATDPPVPPAAQPLDARPLDARGDRRALRGDADDARGAPRRRRTVARHPLGRVPGDRGRRRVPLRVGGDRARARRPPPRAGLDFPLGSRERELVYQWVLFAMARARGRRSSSVARRARGATRSAPRPRRERFARRRRVVERALDGHEFIVGDRFSAADIMVGSVLGFADASARSRGCRRSSATSTALARPGALVANAPAAG